MRAIFILLLLTSCASSINRVNEFLTAQAQPTNLNGTWAGSVFGYVLGLKIKEDGNGYSCYQLRGDGVLDKVKVSNQNIYIANGQKMRVLEARKESFRVDYYDKDVNFVRTESMSDLSLFCVDAFKALP